MPNLGVYELIWDIESGLSSRIAIGRAWIENTSVRDEQFLHMTDRLQQHEVINGTNENTLVLMEAVTNASLSGDSYTFVLMDDQNEERKFLVRPID